MQQERATGRPARIRSAYAGGPHQNRARGGAACRVCLQSTYIRPREDGSSDTMLRDRVVSCVWRDGARSSGLARPAHRVESERAESMQYKYSGGSRFRYKSACVGGVYDGWMDKPCCQMGPLEALGNRHGEIGEVQVLVLGRRKVHRRPAEERLHLHAAEAARGAVA